MNQPLTLVFLVAAGIGLVVQNTLMVRITQSSSTILIAMLLNSLVGIVLFSIGTGPVKGFAVTLMIGIFTSVWTAIVVTRALVNLYYGGRQVKSLWIGNYI